MAPFPKHTGRYLSILAALALTLSTVGCGDDDGDVHDAGIDATDPMDAGDATADAGQDAGQDAAVPVPCELDYDCPTGQVCLLGFCEDFEPECQDENDCTGTEVCLENLCLDEGISPGWGTVIFNEVLADGTADGDANQDGTTDAMEDEFVELVNVSSQAVDLSGWTLVETDWASALPRHTFEAGTVVAPGGALVIFGGGDPPPSTSTVIFQASNAADPGIPFGLDLDDAGDQLRLLDDTGLLVAVFAYGDEGGTPAVSDESMTRDPDLLGGFLGHSTATGSASAVFSPGTRVDGSPF